MKKLLASALMLFGLTSCVLIPSRSVFSHGDSALEKGILAFQRADYVAAKELLRSDAHGGNPDAQYLMGLIYLYGLDGEQNSFLAQQNLTEAALSDHYASQEVLALMYSDRFRPLYNPVEAYRWFKVVSAHTDQYDDRANAIYAVLRSNGMASAAKNAPPVRGGQYHGINFNPMFPLR